MNAHAKDVIEACTQEAEDGSLTFPAILQKLAAVGVESYYADLRRRTKTYYLEDGESLEVNAGDEPLTVGNRFDADSIVSAVRQSQANTHSYKEFCRKITQAGCPAYIVSLKGRRAVYLSRAAETYTEHFPQAK